jgi:tetratricopeptide (TPR) repeat protein
MKKTPTMRKQTKMFFIASGMALLSVCSATTHGGQAEGVQEKLGKVHFPISCSTEAQTQFNQALAMAHNFWFPQSVNAFSEVTKTDPGCAMAHWGIAISQRANPLVSPPQAPALKRGWEAVEKAKALGAKTERERDYIAAIESYYKDWEKLDYRTRVLAYEQAMEQISLRYPEDPEATVFYALALNEAITVLPADKTYARHLKAAAILDKVLQKDPDHPGALHYLIHSYDFPPLAARGLPAAQRYAGVAPSAPHALHMPSHIFSMLGMWQESVRSNQAAITVAKSYVHAMDFMAYAYLQGAQDQEAKRIVDMSAALQKAQSGALDRTPTGAVLTVYTASAAIPARYAIERGAWAEAATLQPSPSASAADAITHFTRAMGFARSGDAGNARKEIDKLQSLREELLQSKDGYWAEQVEIQRMAGAAWVAHAEGKKADALRLMRSAADLEDASEKHVAMENRLWPMRELLGELLLGTNEPAQALKEFEVSLQAARNRYRGFYGAAKAAERLGDRQKAKAFYEKLIAVCNQADTERPELQEARAFLAKK